MGTTFQQAIRNKDFKEALAKIERGDDLLKSDFMFALSDSFRDIVRNEAYEVLNALVENEEISLDIFEYDTFNKSIFKAIVEYLPSTNEAKEFLGSFVAEVENLEDAVDGLTFLGLAIENKMDKDLVAVMIENGCDINYLNNNEQNFLHILANSPAHMGEDKIVPLVELLVDNGLDFSKKDNGGNTPLHIATTRNLKKTIEFLLDQGADPAEENSKGDTAFKIAMDRGYNELNDLLSQYGEADSEQSADMCYDFVKNIYSNSPSEGDIEQMKKFADVDIYLERKDAYGNLTTILDEMLKKSYEWFEVFLDVFEIDVEYSDNAENTILHKVCAINLNFEESKSKDLYKKVKKLLKLGANPSLTNNMDKTPIDLASTDNLKEKTVLILLKAKG